MSKELWVVGSGLNPLVMADSDWWDAAEYLRKNGFYVTDNKEDYEAKLKETKND